MNRNYQFSRLYSVLFHQLTINDQTGINLYPVVCNKDIFISHLKNDHIGT